MNTTKNCYTLRFPLEYKILLFSFTLLCNLNCGTINSIEKWNTTDSPVVFGGIRSDLISLGKLSKDESIWAGLQKIFLLIDLPLSFTFDLVLLPVTIPMGIKNDRE